MGEMDAEKLAVRVRECDVEKDLAAVEDLERRCQVGLSGDSTADDDGDNGCKNKRRRKKAMSLCVEQVGDPLARVRHAPDHIMLVAEHGKEIVGFIKACVRIVSRGGGKKASSSSSPSSSSSSASSLSSASLEKLHPSSPPPTYVQVACILGLRVCPFHRRLGIATKLVKQAEEWCRARGAVQATMATTSSNAASLALFTGQFGYVPFRRPEFLGRPVHAHSMPVPREHRILQLPPVLAAATYARLLPPQATEFLPADTPALLAHKLTLGTFMAVESSPDPSLPPSFALLSVWDSTHSMHFRVRDAPALLRASLAVLRALDHAAPWMRVPSIPDIFRPFGAYLLYGLRMSGPVGPELLRSLCDHAHNVARKNPACAVVAADIAPDDPAAAAVPRWRRFSCDEDVWCIKRLDKNDNAGSDEEEDDWAAPAAPGTVLFVDPREF